MQDLFRQMSVSLIKPGILGPSIGYVVFCDGVAIHDNFAQVKEGNTGIKEGQKALQNDWVEISRRRCFGCYGRNELRLVCRI